MKDTAEIHELLHKQMHESFDEMHHQFNQSLYGDASNPKRRSFKERFSDLKWRVQAAWLVLTGRADIC